MARYGKVSVPKNFIFFNSYLMPTGSMMSEEQFYKIVCYYKKYN